MKKFQHRTYPKFHLISINTNPHTWWLCGLIWKWKSHNVEPVLLQLLKPFCTSSGQLWYRQVASGLWPMSSRAPLLWGGNCGAIVLQTLDTSRPFLVVSRGFIFWTSPGTSVSSWPSYVPSSSRSSGKGWATSWWLTHAWNFKYLCCTKLKVTRPKGCIIALLCRKYVGVFP